MLVGIILVIIFISILVLVHELGHFWTAKKFGLLVEEFGFGLPPRIWGKKIGETIYSVNALPFGGFVKIYGENREDEIVSEPDEVVSVTQMQEEITVLENQLTIDEKLTVEKIIVPNCRSFNSISIGRRALITFAGVLMNFLLGWLIISVIFFIGIPQSLTITKIQSNSPAAEIGLMAGDKIVGVTDEFARLPSPDGEAVGGQVNSDRFIKFVNDHQGKEINLKIEREGQVKEFKAIPRVNPPAGEGALGVGLIEAGFPKENLFLSIWDGLKTSLGIIKEIFVTIFNLIAKLFIGQANLEQIAGPVGIVKITAQASSLGFFYLIQLLALISLNLVVINILPFPALDGGRLLFLLIEKIKGSPLPIKFERYANSIGMALLIFLMIAITIKDVMKF